MSFCASLNQQRQRRAQDGLEGNTDLIFIIFLVLGLMICARLRHQKLVTYKSASALLLHTATLK